MDKLIHLIRQHLDEVTDFFHQTKTLAVILLDENLRISAHNPYFSTLIAAKENLLGKPMQSYLLQESRGLLPLSDSNKWKPIRLNFKSQESSAIPLQCHILKIKKGGHMIFGGHLMLTNEDILQKMTLMSNEMANLARALQQKNNKLKEAYSKIKILSGIIPICMHCKEIRDDKGYWNQLEEFITKHSEAHFSHSICDKCREKCYSDL